MLNIARSKSSAVEWLNAPAEALPFEEYGDESPYTLGDKVTLEKLFRSSGVTDIQTTTHQGTARFESIESWIHTGAKGWTADDAISDGQLKLLLKAAEEELASYKTVEGSISFSTSAHIIIARK